MSLVRFYVAELKTRHREVERLRAELAKVRKTRREAMERVRQWAADVVHAEPLRSHILAANLDAIERELDAREESDG